MLKAIDPTMSSSFAKPVNSSKRRWLLISGTVAALLAATLPTGARADFISDQAQGTIAFDENAISAATTMTQSWQNPCSSNQPINNCVYQLTVTVSPVALPCITSCSNAPTSTNHYYHIYVGLDTYDWEGIHVAEAVLYTEDGWNGSYSWNVYVNYGCWTNSNPRDYSCDQRRLGTFWNSQAWATNDWYNQYLAKVSFGPMTDQTDWLRVYVSPNGHAWCSGGADDGYHV